MKSNLCKISETSSTFTFITLHIKTKCQRTYIHSVNVASYASQLAALIIPNEIDVVKIAGLLHDVGKIMIDDKILHKNGRLTSVEYEEMKKHSIYGYEYLKASCEFEQYAEIVRHHHERWDGYGYPDGLSGEKIPIHSRIIAIADAYADMTSIREYRNPLSAAESFHEIKKNADSHFDPIHSQLFLS
ncbi:MAG: HD domain-containing phosphohydrolase [Phycisphaerales bacterium]